MNVFLEDGTLWMPSGVTQPHKAGDVVYFDRGSVANPSELVTNVRMRALTVELKDVPTVPLQAVGVPAAFPRSKAAVVLDNASVRCRRRGAFEATHAGYVISERVLGAPAHVTAIERK